MKNVLIVHDSLPFFIKRKVAKSELWEHQSSPSNNRHGRQESHADQIVCQGQPLKYILIESPTQDSSGKSVGLVRDPQT